MACLHYTFTLGIARLGRLFRLTVAQWAELRIVVPAGMG